MTNEFEIATENNEITAMDLLRLDNKKLLIFWSTAKGTFFKFINNTGIADKSSIRVALKNRFPNQKKVFWPQTHDPLSNVSKFSSVKISKNIIAQCLTVQNSPKQYISYVALIDIKTLRTVKITQLGSPDDRYISCSSDKTGIFAVWQKKDSSKIILARLDNNANIVKTKELISSIKATPVISTNTKGTLLVYSKSNLPHKTVISLPVDKDLNTGKTATIDNHIIDNTEPFLLTTNDGFALTFKDNRDHDGIDEFYFTLLSNYGIPQYKPVRISRADGPTAPKLTKGKDLFFSAAIRSYRSNYLVGFNRFNRKGIKQGGEFQVYADKNNFTKTELSALDIKHNNVLLIYAEQKESTSRILSSTISCKQ